MDTLKAKFTALDPKLQGFIVLGLLIAFLALVGA